jgi:tetratricopeptide (TPR) repeat protein
VSDDHYERGNELFLAERYADAVREYERALVDSDDPDLHENLGLALWKLGRWRAASRSLLRVLDGELTRREQSLRILVSCMFREGHVLDGERLLRVYERAFGPHPEGWART